MGDFPTLGWRVARMNRFAYFWLAAAQGMAILGSALPARGQPTVAPAAGVRVIEVLDPVTGERARAVAVDLTAAEVAHVQRRLASVGFDPGRATGLLTPETRLTLGRFQASRGLIRCECVSYETLVALTIRPFVVASIVAPVWSGYFSDPLGFGEYAYGLADPWLLPGVIVGHSPTVFVGHDPAIGAGQLRPRVPHRPRPPIRHSPARRRDDSGISGSGAPLRDLTPRRPTPSRPTPSSPRPAGSSSGLRRAD